MIDKKRFLLGSFWGRYALFSIFVFAVSLSALFIELDSFPTSKTGAIFIFIVPHFIYWMIRVFIKFERDIIRAKDHNPRRFSFNRFILMGVGLALGLYGLYQLIFYSETTVLPFIPIGVAIVLAGYDTAVKSD